MPNIKISEQDFVRICNNSKSISEIAKQTGGNRYNVKARIKRLIPLYGDLTPKNTHPQQTHSFHTDTFQRKKKYTIVFFSDAHFWPEYLCDLSTAYLSLLKVLDDIKPDIIHDNGDSFDGASISRFPKNRISTTLPTVSEEIEINEECHRAIQEASPKSKLHWNWGNHDARFNNYILANSPEISDLPFSSLEDYFPDWSFSDNLIYNETLYTTHQWKGGVGAARNNALNAGMSFLTGHTHVASQVVISDLKGIRYGLEVPSLADSRGSQFKYVQGIPNWQSGILVLTVDGKEIHPESALVNNNGKLIFRGKSY